MLTPCTQCHRHIHSDASCPFCERELADQAKKSSGLGMTLATAAAAGAALIGCSDKKAEPSAPEKEMVAPAKPVDGKKADSEIKSQGADDSVGKTGAEEGADSEKIAAEQGEGDKTATAEKSVEVEGADSKTAEKSGDAAKASSEEVAAKHSIEKKSDGKTAAEKAAAAKAAAAKLAAEKKKLAEEREKIREELGKPTRPERPMVARYGMRPRPPELKPVPPPSSKPVPKPIPQ